MDFLLSEDQQMIQAAAREFAQSETAPMAAGHDASGTCPSETIRKASELGFMGVEVPAGYGGAGSVPVSYVFMLEEIAAAEATRLLPGMPFRT